MSKCRLQWFFNFWSTFSWNLSFLFVYSFLLLGPSLHVFLNLFTHFFLDFFIFIFFMFKSIQGRCFIFSIFLNKLMLFLLEDRHTILINLFILKLFKKYTFLKSNDVLLNFNRSFFFSGLFLINDFCSSSSDFCANSSFSLWIFWILSKAFE